MVVSSKRPAALARHQSWVGLATNASPHAIPPGALVEQRNFTCVVPGMLRGRNGLLPLSTTTGTSDFLNLASFRRPERDYLIAQQADGDLVAIPGPAFSAVGTAIETGVNNFQPLSFAKSRFGFLLAVNGLARGLRWNGESSTTDLGIDAPTAAPSATTPVSGGAEAGDYVIAFRYRADEPGGPFYSSISPTATITAVALDKFEYTGLTASSNGRVTHVEIYRSTVGQATTLYKVAEVTNGTTTYTTDTFTDAQLEDEDTHPSLPIFFSDGRPNANRFTPPPSHKAVVIAFQDRMWYGVDVTYDQGTIAVTNSSTTVTGTGTDWTTEMAGRYLYIDDEGEGLEIASVASGTSLTLSTAYGGSTDSGLGYAIQPSPDERNKWYYSERDEAESVPVGNVLKVQDTTKSIDDDFVGAAQHGSFLYCFMRRHTFSFSYVEQPRIDANVDLAYSRGAISHRTWELVEDVLYVMDELGVYRFSGGAPEPISQPIQDYFRDDLLDFSKSKWWFCRYDERDETIRWYVTFAEDSGETRPMRALCYGLRTQAWWEERYYWPVGGAAMTRVSDAPRLVLAGPDERVFSYEGLSDGIAASIRGTATSGGATTLTDSTASFTSAVVGATVAITEGLGLGQVRVITAATSTELTVDTAWSDNPDATSKYMIGGIAWAVRTGRHMIAIDEETRDAGVRVTYEPTSVAQTIVLQDFFDHDALAEQASGGPFDRYDRLEWDDASRLRVMQQAATDEDGFSVPGYYRYQFVGASDDMVECRRFYAVRAFGFQGDDRSVLHRLDLHGVEAG